jgi:proteic killer suppression protein
VDPGPGLNPSGAGSRRREDDKLHVAARIEDLRIPPQNRLEALKGDRKGQWSIRINDQWRLCFRFEKGAAFDVEIVTITESGKRACVR